VCKHTVRQDLRKGKKQASDLARFIVPENIGTGFSNFNTKTGNINIDPSIRAGQEDFLTNISAFRDPVNSAFSRYDEGLEGLQARSTDLRADFEGNESAFRELTLNPVREAIATRGGALTKELGRTDVRGSFRDQELNNFGLDAGRALSDTEAKIENQRINRLGDFLEMDAGLLKESLGSETGRIGMLSKLESMLAGVSTERFNQEIRLLGLPAALVQGKMAGADILGNAQGLDNAASTELVGSLLGLVGGDGGNNSSGGPGSQGNSSASGGSGAGPHR